MFLEVDDWIESNFGTKFSNGNYGIFVLVSKESICFKHSNEIIWGKYRHSFLCLSHLNPSEIDELSKRILSSSKRFLSQSSDFTQVKNKQNLFFFFQLIFFSQLRELQCDLLLNIEFLLVF